jgi:excisionase family DNA binding protein
LRTEITNTEPLETKPRGVVSSSTARPDAWRVNDALRQLSISRATLYKMASSGDIRLARIGGRTLVPDAEIKRLVWGRRVIDGPDKRTPGDAWRRRPGGEDWFIS